MERPQVSRKALFLVAGFLAVSISCHNQSEAPGDKVSMMRVPTTVETFPLESPIGPGLMTISESEDWNGQVWVYFHGSFGNIDSWKDFYRRVTQYRTTRETEQANSSGPVIVSLSFGELWLLTPAERYDGAMTTVFSETVLPLLEDAVPPESRYVGIGYSMGGFNLLAAYADRPDLWSRIVLLNPALTSLSPYADSREIIDYHRSSYLGFATRIKLLAGIREEYPIEEILRNERRFIASDAEWSIANPILRFENSSAGVSSTDTSFFLSCGKNDPYGFILGSRRLEDAIRAKTESIEANYHRAGHSFIPYAELGTFLFDE